MFAVCLVMFSVLLSMLCLFVGYIIYFYIQETHHVQTTT